MWKLAKQFALPCFFGLSVALFPAVTTLGDESAEALRNEKDVYTLFKDFLPGVAAFVGLLGIGLAAHLNFRLNRKRDRNQQLANAKALAIILLSEVASLEIKIYLRRTAVRHLLEDRARLLTEDDLIGLDPPKWPVHEERRGDLGILPADQVRMLGMMHGIHLEMAADNLMQAKNAILHRERLLALYNEDRERLIDSNGETKRLAGQMPDATRKQQILDEIDQQVDSLKKFEGVWHALELVGDAYDLALNTAQPLKESFAEFAGITKDELVAHYQFVESVR